MDTNFNFSLESSLSDIKLDEPTRVKILAEYLPRLSLVSLYVTLNRAAGDEEGTSVIDLKILVTHDSISIPVLDIYSLQFFGIKFVPQRSLLRPTSSNKNVFYFRIIANPPFESLGSAEAELLPSSDEFDDGMSIMLKYSANHFIPLENCRYDITCQSCGNCFVPEAVFKTIRQMPGLNWEEKATDLWCHPPACTVNSESADFKNSHTPNPTSRKTVFEMLSCPELHSCYYSTTFYAISSKIIQGVSTEVNDPARCFQCKNEIGCWYSKDCIHLWDYGVKWMPQNVHPTPNVAAHCSILQNEAHLKLLQNFKRSVFACICEWSYSSICQFVLKSSIGDDSILLWSSDKNLTIFQTEFCVRGTTADLVLKPEKVAKFLFLQKQSAENSTCTNNSTMLPVGSSYLEVLTIPGRVFQAGIKKLIETSELFLDTEQILKCGFLSYSVD